MQKTRKKYGYGLLKICAACLMLHAGAGLSVTRYVSTNGAHVSPYTNWVNAATNIARAVIISGNGDEIIVSNGVHYCSTLSVSAAVKIRSLNGPAVTTIDNSRFWGLLLSGTGVVDGFTIQNGSNVNSSSMLLQNDSTVQNCIFTNNWAYRGGALDMRGNSLVSNCVFVGNTGSNRGGAVYVYAGLSNRIYDSTFYNNVCEYGEGGAIYVFLAGGVECRNCLIYSNQSAGTGGGINGTTNVILGNCTITMNQSGGHGGGVYPTVGAFNTIIQDNIAPGFTVYTNWSSSAGFTNCCIGWQIAPAILGANNFTNAPGFIAPLAGNFRLKRGASCVNVGLNQPWMETARDLDGRPRLDRFDRLVDVGCYEYVSRGMMFMFQ